MFVLQYKNIRHRKGMSEGMGRTLLRTGLWEDRKQKKSFCISLLLYSFLRHLPLETLRQPTRLEGPLQCPRPSGLECSFPGSRTKGRCAGTMEIPSGAATHTPRAATEGGQMSTRLLVFVKCVTVRSGIFPSSFLFEDR